MPYSLIDPPVIKHGAHGSFKWFHGIIQVWNMKPFEICLRYFKLDDIPNTIKYHNPLINHSWLKLPRPFWIIPRVGCHQSSLGYPGIAGDKAALNERWVSQRLEHVPTVGDLLFTSPENSAVSVEDQKSTIVG